MKNVSLCKYKNAMGRVLLYQFISKAILCVLIQILLFLQDLIIELTNISFLANADLQDFFCSLPVVFLVLFTFLLLSFYVIVDINGMILLSHSILQNETKNVFALIKEALKGCTSILNKNGIPIFVFSFLLCPFYICFYRHSLMEGFYLPDFLFSILNKTPVLYIPFILILILFIAIGFIYSFTLPAILLKKEDVASAFSFSKGKILSNRKEYINIFISIFVKYILIGMGICILFGILPFLLISHCFLQSSYLETLLTLVYFVDICILCLIKCLYPVYFTMDVINIVETAKPEKSSIHLFRIAVIALCLLLVASIGVQTGNYFNTLFPIKNETKIIAHKAGGKYANENSLEGIEASIEHNVYGAEIDVQRTKDGSYIIHHDDTFERLCGINKTSSQLTLEECRNLKAKDSYHTTFSQLATMQEILDTAKGKIHVFIELKGETADSKMAEDIYQMVINRDMISEVTFISLNYDVISELETNHPDADTGFLCYVALGNIENINCDKLMLENAMATSTIISKIHSANKEVYIWTVDSYSGLEERFLDDTDGIITNEVDLALQVKNQVNTKNPIYRVMNQIIECY